MKILWQQGRKYMPIAALVLLCMFMVPAAQANTNSNGNSTASTQHTEAQSSTVAVAASDEAPAKAKPKAANKPRQKSVLDAEVLESPIEYFRNAFYSEEDEADVAPNSGPVMITVKALVATLLSTIL
jgi:hypothetical protein